MTTIFLTKRSGLAGLVGGIFLPVFMLLHSQRDAYAVLHSPYALTHVLGIFSILLILFGLLGGYIKQVDRLGRFGHWAFITAFLGTALWLGIQFVDATLNPVLAKYDPALQTSGHNEHMIETFGTLFGPAILLMPVSVVMFIVGTVLYAVATLRTGVFPKLASWFVIFGVLQFGAAPHVPIFVETIGAALLGLGYAWMGGVIFNFPEKT